MAQPSALVNVIIHDKYCQKIVLNWTVLEVRDTVAKILLRIIFRVC